MFLAASLRTLARAFLIALPLLAGCGEEAPPALDEGARVFVQQLEAALARGQRPDLGAVQALKQLADEHPGDPAIARLMLQLLPGLRDWDGLARWLEAKAALGMGTGFDEDEQLALAKVHLNLADYDAAWRAVAPLAARRPDELEANALAGRVAFLRGDAVAAALHLDRVWPQLRTAGRADEMSHRALLHLDADELERARAVLDDALALKPDSVQAHKAMARVLAADGDEAGAERHQQRAAELQAVFTAEEQRLTRRAAQNSQLNDTFARGDFEGCERLVLRFLIGAEPGHAQELLTFLERLYLAAGRADEAPAALEAARSLIEPPAPR